MPADKYQAYVSSRSSLEKFFRFLHDAESDADADADDDDDDDAAESDAESDADADVRRKILDLLRMQPPNFCPLINFLLIY